MVRVPREDGMHVVLIEEVDDLATHGLVDELVVLRPHIVRAHPEERVVDRDEGEPAVLRGLEVGLQPLELLRLIGQAAVEKSVVDNDEVAATVVEGEPVRAEVAAVVGEVVVVDVPALLVDVVRARVARVGYLQLVPDIVVAGSVVDGHLQRLEDLERPLCAGVEVLATGEGGDDVSRIEHEGGLHSVHLLDELHHPVVVGVAAQLAGLGDVGV